MYRLSGYDCFIPLPPARCSCRDAEVIVLMTSAVSQTLSKSFKNFLALINVNKFDMFDVSELERSCEYKRKTAM